MLGGNLDMRLDEKNNDRKKETTKNTLSRPTLGDNGNVQIALKKEQSSYNNILKIKKENNQRHKIYKDHRAAQAVCLL